MLAADERNFHCWNYRSWVINSQLDQYDEIEKAHKLKAELKVKKEKDIVKEENPDEGEKETKEENHEKEPKEFIALEMKMKKLKEEFEMTSQMIEKNFSNFSAWHYRSKLLLKIHKDNGSQYKVPLDLIQKELDKIKHAIFTEPNDQSPWNYHRWLVSLLVPTYITNLSINDDEKVVNIDFSEVIFDISPLKCEIGGVECELKSRTNKPESKMFSIIIPNDIFSITESDIKVSQKSCEGIDESLYSNKSVNCFNELLEFEDD